LRIHDLIKAENAGAHEFESGNADQGELALIDWVSVAGLSIFAAFICYSVVLFGKGANRPAENQTQVLVHSLQARDITSS
jgi:hypothetical protein